MSSLEDLGVYEYFSQNVMLPLQEERFHMLVDLQLEEILNRKTPYWITANTRDITSDFVKNIVDEYMLSQEETIFGNYLEAFAIHVSDVQYGGFKSSFPSIDLEFFRGGKYYLVGIKSGPNWGNSDQIKRMKNNFKSARVTLRKEQSVSYEIICVNGCIYGKDNNPFKQDKNGDSDKDYYKYCGQAFWQFISDDPNLYLEIIKPIDEQAKQKDETFKLAYASKVNEMTEAFSKQFTTNHQIDWVKLVEFVSKNDAYKKEESND